MQPGREVAGIINLKQVYEIANFKSNEELYAHLPLKSLCIQVINSALQAGIKVVNRDLDADEYARFLAERKEVEEQQVKEISDKRTAKLMRTSTATSTAKK
jgi:large subunit ribosomal protein L11